MADINGITFDLETLGITGLGSGSPDLALRGKIEDPWGVPETETIRVPKDLAIHVDGISAAFVAFRAKAFIAARAQKAIEVRDETGSLPSGLPQDVLNTIAAYDAAQE